MRSWNAWRENYRPVINDRNWWAGLGFFCVFLWIFFLCVLFLNFFFSSFFFFFFFFFFGGGGWMGGVGTVGMCFFVFNFFVFCFFVFVFCVYFLLLFRCCFRLFVLLFCCRLCLFVLFMLLLLRPLIRCVSVWLYNIIYYSSVQYNTVLKIAANYTI